MNFEKQSTLEKPILISPPQPGRQTLLVAGVLCILFSFGLFLFQEFYFPTQRQASEKGVFLFNYLIAAIYFFVLVGKRRFSSSKPLPFLDHFFLFLVLGLISDFALNKQMVLFQPSADWLTVWLLLVAAAMTVFAFREYLPRPLHLVMVFLLGSGVVLFGYFALYLLPYYFFGALGTLALGLGLHVFIPLAAVVSLVVAARRLGKADDVLLRTFVVGALVPILFSLVYLSLWQVGQQKVTKLLHSYEMQDQKDLPRWVFLSQRVPVTPIFERLVKADLVYQTPEGSFGFFDMPTRQFEELKRHDPLVMLAAYFFKTPDLTTRERIKILESRFTARHLAQERLWSGTHLSTSNVITQAQLFPRQRFSYTEKILTVHNSRASTWGEEEAIYTFYLPAGSVVTSLSLWINGVEQKGYLTTQSKAEKAYNTIVGVEVRDPSVVHWQEGNTVSVRVFPCTPQESRQFKIGITSPLREENGQLVYENIYFDGPTAQNAPETTVLRLEEVQETLSLPPGFEQITPGRFERYGPYAADWSFRVQTPPLSTAPFTFAGHTYQMAPFHQQYETFQPQEIYLDLHKHWTEEEFNFICQLGQPAKVYALLGNSLVRVTPENRQEIFQKSQQFNFTLFPLHQVRRPDQALIISKGTAHSPQLSDLRESQFATDFAKRAAHQPAVRFFQLGKVTSPYIKTLKELSMLKFDQGTPEDLQALLRQKRFVQTSHQPATVLLPEAGVTITRSPSADKKSSTGSDHLMRLFAYNHLLQQIGPRYFQQEYLEEHLIEEAAQANVVSPLSSLIVLETKKDYERFGIEESKNSLGNAQVTSSGAVPEPHEWVLIILVIAVIGYTLLKPRLLS